MPGVTATSIKLGATVVESGDGSSFLGPVRWAMYAVRDKANREGGICGRRIELVVRDDGWSAQLGNQYIRNLVEQEKVFALAVNPSSEGLRVASRSGYLREQGVPVVGTDGMLISQYTDPVIFPVASSTISAMHIMAKEASDRAKAAGQKFYPAIVYDSRYRFGVEGAHAFNQAVKRLTGKELRTNYTPETSAECTGTHRLCGLSQKDNYSTERENIKNACNEEPKCNFLVFAA